ncbi:MAG: hypothetical protein M0T84_03740 [Betaproteobacteria bacterium]|nr:hypothetical protein [Betaproteobacteria bacterium]
MNADDPAVASLLQAIRVLPGKKIVTLACAGADDLTQVDVSASGVIGHADGHDLLLKAKLHRALVSGGGMIIRQFTQIKTQAVAANGKPLWIPIKNLYGVRLERGRWRGLSALDVRRACEPDLAAKGNGARGQWVRYRAFGDPALSLPRAGARE